MPDDRLERVRTRLDASPGLEEAVRRAVADGKVPEAAAAVIPPEDADAAGRDRERLERVVPSDALEAIVQRVGRPPLLVRNDTVELEPLVDFPRVAFLHRAAGSCHRPRASGDRRTQPPRPALPARVMRAGGW